jgi:hypothetical protein
MKYEKFKETIKQLGLFMHLVEMPELKDKK